MMIRTEATIRTMRRMAVSTFARIVPNDETAVNFKQQCSVKSDSKKHASVVAGDPLPDIGRDTLPLLFDDLLRMRPGAGGVRVVGAKHHFVGVQNAAEHLYANGIVNEAEPNLAVVVFDRERIGQIDVSIAGYC